MTAIGCLHAPYLLLALTSGPKRHLVGAKAHWRSPSLLAQALTPQAHPTFDPHTTDPLYPTTAEHAAIVQNDQKLPPALYTH